MPCSMPHKNHSSMEVSQPCFSKSKNKAHLKISSHSMHQKGPARWALIHWINTTRWMTAFETRHSPTWKFSINIGIPNKFFMFLDTLFQIKNKIKMTLALCKIGICPGHNDLISHLSHQSIATHIPSLGWNTFVQIFDSFPLFFTLLQLKSVRFFLCTLLKWAAASMTNNINLSEERSSTKSM